MSDNEIKKHIFAVIMAGGGGERFWPKSRQACPKQLLKIFGDRSMIQATTERISPLVTPERMMVITNRIQAPLIREQLPAVPETSIVAEPFGRDTAACIAMATAMVMERDPDGIMIVLPADHIIKDREKLNATFWEACRIAWEKGCLVTLGIKPTGPSTGYGYIRKSDKIETVGKVSFARVDQFMEKPDRETAKRYIESGSYLWNSGMFVWRASAIAAAFKQYMPELYAAYERIRQVVASPDREAVIQEIYSGLEKISIDYGIMEKAGDVVVAEAGFDWDDAGSWLAIARHYPPDGNGNVILGESAVLDTENCVILADSGMVGCLGIKDLIVVKTEDAVLVCPCNRAQEVKKIVQELKAREHLKKYA